MFKKQNHLCRCLAAALLFVAAPAAGFAADVVTSPDGSIKVTIGVKDGRPYYTVNHNDKVVVNTSYLGFRLSDAPFDNDFKITSKSRNTKHETWTQSWGEDRVVDCHYNELRVNLQQKDRLRRQLSLVFRVFNDGLGFRYEFPRQKNLGDFQIMEEKTEIAMPVDAEAWTEPTNRTRYYEALWTKAPLSTKDTVSTPITIEVGDSLFMVLHEANLTDYSSLN